MKYFPETSVLNFNPKRGWEYSQEIDTIKILEEELNQDSG